MQVNNELLNDLHRNVCRHHQRLHLGAPRARNAKFSAMAKIVRSVCVFANEITNASTARLHEVAKNLEDIGFQIQTKRMCSPTRDVDHFVETAVETAGEAIGYLSIGTVSEDEIPFAMASLRKHDKLAFNLNLSTVAIDLRHVAILFDIIQENPARTFNFTYTFNNSLSSPYFPSSGYERDGFTIGLQSPSLAEGCNSIEEWFAVVKQTWAEVAYLFASDQDFLGIDSSVAPLGSDASLLAFLNRVGHPFERSTTTDVYVRITEFMKKQNPKPIGLCGLMLPCLEDADLAAEYDRGNFTIERNIYLSLHSGLGIDAYPIGVDESPERVVEILRLLQALSNKHQKPLSARFVSDGVTRIGCRTDFQHPYLQDCTIRPL